MRILHYYTLPYVDADMSDSNITIFKEDYASASAHASDIGGIVMMTTYEFSDTEMLEDHTIDHVLIVSASGGDPAKAMGCSRTPSNGVYYPNSQEGARQAEREIQRLVNTTPVAQFQVYCIELGDALEYELVPHPGGTS